MGSPVSVVVAKCKVSKVLLKPGGLPYKTDGDARRKF